MDPERSNTIKMIGSFFSMHFYLSMTLDLFLANLKSTVLTILLKKQNEHFHNTFVNFAFLNSYTFYFPNYVGFESTSSKS